MWLFQVLLALWRVMLLPQDLKIVWVVLYMLQMQTVVILLRGKRIIGKYLLSLHYIQFCNEKFPPTYILLFIFSKHLQQLSIPGFGLNSGGSFYSLCQFCGSGVWSSGATGCSPCPSICGGSCSSSTGTCTPPSRKIAALWEVNIMHQWNWTWSYFKTRITKMKTTMLETSKKTKVKERTFESVEEANSSYPVFTSFLILVSVVRLNSIDEFS